MAAGLPVVSTNGKGNTGLVRDEFNGYMLNEHNVDQFAEKIEKIIFNQELYKNE